MSTQKQSKPSSNGDRLQQLITAAQQEREASLAVEAVLQRIYDKLSEVNERISKLETTHSVTDRELQWIKGIVQATYNNVSTLLQFMAAMWRDDRSSLTTLQQRIAEQAFVMSQRKDQDAASISVEVDAGGDVKVSADRVGGDKKEIDDKRC